MPSTALTRTCLPPPPLYLARALTSSEPAFEYELTDGRSAAPHSSSWRASEGGGRPISVFPISSSSESTSRADLLDPPPQASAETCTYKSTSCHAPGPSHVYHPHVACAGGASGVSQPSAKEFTSGNSRLRTLLTLERPLFGAGRTESSARPWMDARTHWQSASVLYATLHKYTDARLLLLPQRTRLTD
jgi:hypothetical protein